MIWMYLTPIFYSVEIVPKWAKPLVWGNPLTQYLTFSRILLIDGALPELQLVILSLLSAVFTCLAGMFVFYRLQKNFILRL